MDGEPEFIDEAVLEQRLRQAAVPVQREVLTFLLFKPGPISIASVSARRFSASSVTSASRNSMAQSGGSPTTPSAETRVDSMIFRTTASTVAFGHEDQPGGGKESQVPSQHDDPRQGRPADLQ
jgi:hypothetical protein